MTLQRYARLPALPLSPPRLAGGALFLALALFGLAGCWMILGGRGHLAVAALPLSALLLMILVRWQRGVYALLAYVPVAGVVTLSLSPWQGWPLLHPVLYKDWFFVLPAYLGYLASLVLRRERLPRLPRLPAPVTYLLLGLGLLVVAQMANPGVPNLVSALIGAKVWLLYVPLYVLAFALIESRHNLQNLMRLLVALAVIPCLAGLAEYVLALTLGYQAAMSSIYGATAAQATQGFTFFEVGGGLLPRIPSTFTFVSQYFGFTLAMLVPCYIVWQSDPSPRWRRLGQWTLALVAVASFLSGARGAFIFVPLLLGLMFGLDRGFSGVLRAGLYVSVALASALAISRMGARALFDHVSELFFIYAAETAYGDLVHAILQFPLGSGTGTNTGPARYAFERPENFIALQNYYAKATIELGIPGLLLVWGLLFVLLRIGFRTRRHLKDPALRTCSAVLLAFLLTMALNSFKGWLLDLDPINVYFWVFAGVLAKLPYLDRPESVPAGHGPHHEETR